MRTWDDRRDFLLDEAARDLVATGEVRPCLVAFRGDEPLLLAWSRPFEKGAYHEPLLELLTLAAMLRADRLALSLSGRAWSHRDPIPPVVDGAGDLRQRVVLVESVDATRVPPERGSLIVPFELDGETVRWGEDRLDLDGADGWASGALLTAAEGPAELRGSDEETRMHALRCVALGHLLAFEQAVVDRLDLGAFAAPPP
jgi:hypothetical protein